MKADVFWTPIEADCDESAAQEAVERVWRALGTPERLPETGFMMLKCHFGERGHHRFVEPKFVRAVARLGSEAGLKVFASDTNTLYTGARHNAVDHLMLASEHGFVPESLGCPVLVADGLIGRWGFKQKIAGKHFDGVELAGALRFTDYLVAVSHFTGHLAAGIGAAIKNIGMGLATRGGKLAQHNAQPLTVDESLCTACGLCAEWCPQGAITVTEHASIDDEKCISCGYCISICKRGAVNFSWEISNDVLQERVAEYAFGVLKACEGRAAFFNFVVSVYENCDCMSDGGARLCPDVGVVAGYDPVAVDAASLELIKEVTGVDIAAAKKPMNVRRQIEHLAALGGGSLDFALHRV